MFKHRALIELHHGIGGGEKVVEPHQWVMAFTCCQNSTCGLDFLMVLMLQIHPEGNIALPPSLQQSRGRSTNGNSPTSNAFVVGEPVIYHCGCCRRIGGEGEGYRQYVSLRHKGKDCWQQAAALHHGNGLIKLHVCKQLRQARVRVVRPKAACEPELKGSLPDTSNWYNGIPYSISSWFS